MSKAFYFIKYCGTAGWLCALCLSMIHCCVVANLVCLRRNYFVYHESK